MMDKNLMKKSMTKKAFHEEMKKGRSTVGCGFNTGTVSHRSKRDYNRQAEKAKIREIERDL